MVESLFNPRRIATYLIVLIVGITLVGYLSIVSSPASPNPATPSSAGLAPLTLTEIGSPVSIQQAVSSATYMVVTPSYLSSGLWLSGVRYDSAFGFVLLEYNETGTVATSSESQDYPLLIAEQPSNTNPLPNSTAVYPPVVAYTTYANGTTRSRTLAIASTETSGWINSTIDGQAVLTSSQSFAQSQVQWWHNGVWYRLYSTSSLQALEQIAGSMILASST
jgi:hypothetical protein